jgi:hypothetical protein
MKAYVVVNQGEIVYACDDEEEAEAVANEKFNEAIDEAADEMGIDKDDDSQAWRAQYQAGYDGGTYDVAEVETDDFNDDGELDVELSSGEEVTLDWDDLIQHIDIDD